MSSADGAPETESTGKDDIGSHVERHAVEDQPERPERGFSNPMFNETLPACIKSPAHPLQVVPFSLLTISKPKNCNYFTGIPVPHVQTRKIPKFSLLLLSTFPIHCINCKFYWGKDISFDKNNPVPVFLINFSTIENLR
jgi:hypothetical protein